MELVLSDGVLPGPHEAVVFQTVSDGAVLLHTEEEIYYGLNSVAVRIWQLLPDSRDLDDLCERLGQAYPDVDVGELRGDVIELLDSLERAGLVVPRA
jgi:Coenzyme PQQ synthesis protein D (PqqD)